MLINKKILFILLSAILTLDSLSVLGQQAKKVLTNDDVIKMVKEGLPDNVIISTVQQFPANYDVSPDALIQMKRQGVSGHVLTALLEAEKLKNSKPAAVTASSESKTQQKKISKIFNDFVFEIDVCQSSGGDTVTCWLSVTNRAEERRLSISNATYIVDNLRGQYAVEDMWIGKNGKQVYLFETAVSNTLIPQIEMTVVLKFQNVKTNATSLSVLRIACSSEGKDFNADFRNVPITPKFQSSPGPKIEPQQEKQNEVKGKWLIKIPSESTNKSVERTTDPASGSVISSDGGRAGDITSVLDSAARITPPLPFKYKVKHFSFPELREGLDLCAGTITIGKDYLEIVTNSDKSALGYKCDSKTYHVTKDDVQKFKDTLNSKWYEYRPTADYLYVKFTLMEKNGKDKKKKDFYLYPASASITYGTRTHTLTGRVLVCPRCPAIICRNCKEDLVAMKNLLDKFYSKRVVY